MSRSSTYITHHMQNNVALSKRSSLNHLLWMLMLKAKHDRDITFAVTHHSSVTSLASDIYERPAADSLTWSQSPRAWLVVFLLFIQLIRIRLVTGKKSVLQQQFFCSVRNHHQVKVFHRGSRLCPAPKQTFSLSFARHSWFCLFAQHISISDTRVPDWESILMDRQQFWSVDGKNRDQGDWSRGTCISFFSFGFFLLCEFVAIKLLESASAIIVFWRFRSRRRTDVKRALKIPSTELSLLGYGNRFFP